MIIIGVCGRKGGSGKTTIAVHLAAELSSRGRSVVLVDCDRQKSATHWSEPGNLPMPVVQMPFDEATVDWRDAVESTEAEIAVLDGPPHLDAAFTAIIEMCDLAVAPCGPSGLDLMATSETVGLIRLIRARRGNGLPRVLLVPNRIDHRTASGRELTRALTDLGESVAPEIRSRSAFSDAFNNGSWVGTYARNSPAHREIVALADNVLQTLEHP